MLALVNVSESKHGIAYGAGRQIYELKLNSRVLCEVEHEFEDGAVVLLRRAADELEAKESK